MSGYAQVGKQVNRVGYAAADHFRRSACFKSAVTSGHTSLQSRLGATVWLSRLELTSHGSLALSLAADAVVLPLHTRR
jgi:hypothetical protein